MFIVANHYHTNISFALQYHDPACRSDDPFRAEGWFNFVPGEQAALNIPALNDLRNTNNSHFYYHIIANDGAVWAGQFVTRCPNNAFNLCSTSGENPDDTPRGFRELIVAGVPDFTLSVIPALQPSVDVKTERHQLGGWITATVDGFAPLTSAHWFADGLVGRQGALALGFINTDVNGHGQSVYDARCHPNQFDAATVRVVDQLTDLTATGQSSAFTC
jgi:hypothetical protein